MACFVVPLVEAVAVTACRKLGKPQGALGRQLPALEKMLWGGSLMLVVDHILNGELMWRFPFFTVAATAGWGEVFREMLTVGVPMSVALTLAWGVYALVRERSEEKSITV